MKKEQKQEWDANTLCIPYISLHLCIVYDCREGRGVIIGNTQSVSISFLFLFFFHQSSLYLIKIFAKCFYLLVKLIVASHHPRLHESGVALPVTISATLALSAPFMKSHLVGSDTQMECRNG